MKLGFLFNFYIIDILFTYISLYRKRKLAAHNMANFEANVRGLVTVSIVAI